MVDVYNLTVVQARVRPVVRANGVVRRDALEENVEHLCDLVRRGANTFRSKLFVLPEFCIHGFELGVPTAAWVEASKHFVNLTELQDRVGEKIAKLIGVEAALVTTGAAGALLLGTAAVVTRGVTSRAMIGVDGRPPNTGTTSSRSCVPDRDVLPSRTSTLSVYVPGRMRSCC